MMQQQIENRLQTVERDNRILKAVLVSMVAIITTAGTMGAARICWYSTLQAQSFVLVDGCGVRRADLAICDGQPALKMYAEDGNAAIVTLKINADQNSSLHMLSKDARVSAVISAAGDNTMIDIGGNQRARLMTNESNGPMLNLLKSGGSQVEIGQIGSDWIFRIRDAAGATELHRVPIR